VHATRIRISSLLASSLLTACSGAVTPTGDAGGGAANQVTVVVQPGAPQIQPGGTLAFTAAVTGTANTSVTWAVQEGAVGGTITDGGTYTAPAASGTFHVVATSVADVTRSGTATVTVTAPPSAVSVTVTPATAAVDACKTRRFQAVVGGTSNGAVTWSVQEGLAGGLVDAGGLYTAPEVDGTYHVVAASVADTTRSATATVTVANRILSVAVAPATTTVSTGGTVPFAALVTTTCGTFPAN
jgi:hypothetical protein